MNRIEIHICEFNNPCLNDAKCVKLAKIDNNTNLDYSCECVNGFTGANCEKGLIFGLCNFEATLVNLSPTLKKLTHVPNRRV